MLSIVPGFEGLLTVVFGTTVLLQKVTESTRPDLRNPQHIVFALHQPNREPMNAKDILTFQCTGVVAPKHVLVPQEIREYREQGVPCRRILNPRNATQQQPQTQQLAVVKHLSKIAIAPTLEALRLVPIWNRIVRDGKLVL